MIKTELWMDANCQTCRAALEISAQWEGDTLAIRVEPCETCLDDAYESGQQEVQE